MIERDAGARPWAERATLGSMDRDGVPDLDDAAADEDDLGAAYRAAMAKPSMTRAAAAKHGMPSEVSVGGHAFSVEVYTTGGPSRSWHDGNHASIEGGRILINGDDAEGWPESLLHEALHAVDWAAGTEAGEAVVNAWAPLILEMLRRNPWLVAYLTADD
jgi:hypothetical protein